MAQLKPLPKLIIFGVLVVGGVYGVKQAMYAGLIPRPNALKTLVPVKTEVLQADVLTTDASSIKAIELPKAAVTSKGGAETRMLVWAWNAQMGAMFANGGPVTTQGSLMEAQGVKLRYTRQDKPDLMQDDLVKFAMALEKGETNPSSGAHFVSIMGDGAAAFLQGIYPRLEKLGPDYTPEVINGIGYSRGEDQFLGLPEWKDNPQAARGALIAGVLRDGDWNIAMRWAQINDIPNNPDDKVYDPKALNWVSTDTYTEASEKYIGNYCEDLPIKGGKKDDTAHVCVNGVVTWTPGDVTVADQKGGLVTLLSTGTALFQMPDTIIGIKKWNAANADKVAGMLAAFGQGADQIRANPLAFRKASEISAAVYKEQSPAYWAMYYKGVTKKDKQGLTISLGGSYSSNLADSMQLFGLSGGPNLFKATYEAWGNVDIQQYPNIMKTYPATSKILNTRYLQMALGRQGEAPTAPAETLTYDSTAPMQEVVGKRAYSILYKTGSAEILPQSFAALDGIASDLETSNTIAILNGYTDSTGNATSNIALSGARAEAVKHYLTAKGGRSIPSARIKTVPHGQDDPVADNSTEAGRAKNRRVEIVLGK